jgi:pyruvate-formate lyase-activating enzyme
MKIQTLSIVCGSRACNAHCPPCVSRMTPERGMTLAKPEIHWRNFLKTCEFAKLNGATTVIITGKGEPTLFPDQMGEFLDRMRPFKFPLIELQTNGIVFLRQREKYERHLDEWYEAGLTTVMVSVVHYDSKKNGEYFLGKPELGIDLAELIELLHDHDLSVRLSCIMAGGYIDSPIEVKNLIRFAKAHRVEQVTVRPVSKPAASIDPYAAAWAEEHAVSTRNIGAIKKLLDREGHKLMTLAHGAVVYDVEGISVCLTDCLTIKPEGDDIRQLIFFPDGTAAYDWQYEGAILFRGRIRKNNGNKLVELRASEKEEGL